ncbi:MAG: 4Fe-4S dicluster domain-containing protein [Dehalococcoidia bacterium]|nr:4Fe-4S dicluster domain-containing protein [Dehalococcoidia bacterium]
MRTPKVREVREALRSLFSKPYTIGYPFQPSVPPERFRGKPKFNDECIGCGACAQVCPARAIEVVDEVKDGKGTRTVTIHHDHCIFCGQCHRYCTVETGVVLTNDFETGTYDRTTATAVAEKELIICQECGGIVGTVDQVRWVADKLGTKAFGNMGLALMLSEDLGLVSKSTRDASRGLDRGDSVSVLCPKCRREVILYEQWGP